MSLTFNKTTLRDAVHKRHDDLVAKAQEHFTKITDPAYPDDQIAAWRAECEVRVLRVAEKIDNGTASDLDFTSLSIPKPPRMMPDKYDVSDARRSVERAMDRRANVLARIDAIDGETFVLTAKQMSDYFDL